MTAAALVELVDASARFGTRTALAPTTIACESGTSLALVGPNGSGKTTLLRLIAGLLEPASGEVRTAPGVRVAYVAQHQHQHGFMPLTVREVLNMSRYGQRGLLGRFRAVDRRAIAAAEELLDVTDLRDLGFGELSGGQRQRVLVASAVATDAAVLLLDEPVTGLDIPSQQRIMDVIRDQRDQGRLVVMSTHDLDEARQCDRVLLLAGRVVADGPPEEVLVREHLAAAFDSHLIDGQGGLRVLDDHGHGSRDH